MMDAISLAVDFNTETFVDILQRNQILNSREHIANVTFQYGDEKSAPLKLIQNSQRSTFQKLVSNDIKERVKSISGTWQFSARGVEHVKLEKGNKYLQVHYRDKSNGVIEPETVKPKKGVKWEVAKLNA
ncbi:hypothetical protein Ddc_12758 [Ditylenchus destructor]|nr:hypothetical protein Ddc_12758 [Ditylenchus destructor]